MARVGKEEEEPALTEELRSLMRPRSGGLLAWLVLIALGLAVLGLVASRTVLSGLWSGAERVGEAGGPTDSFLARGP
jgi:hypothetical protein